MSITAQSCPKSPSASRSTTATPATMSWPTRFWKELNLKATIFSIGFSFGCTEYKDTGNAITPHFTFEQAREMTASGLISIQSHTFDMHQWPPFETAADVRATMSPLPGESEADFQAAILADVKAYRTMYEAAFGAAPIALAYPEGVYSTLTEVTLHENGFAITLCTDPARRNTPRQGAAADALRAGAAERRRGADAAGYIGLFRVKNREVVRILPIKSNYRRIFHMEIIHTEHAPAAIGHSQAIAHCALVFTSGQLPIDPATGSFPEGGIEAQAEQSHRQPQGHSGGRRQRPCPRGKDDLLFAAYVRFRRVQRRLCQALPEQPRKKLLRGRGSAEKRPRRN